MESIIVANANGEEVRDLLYREYDFEVGDDENSFLITCLDTEWETIDDGSRLYIPNTEYGGLFKRLEVNTKNGTVSAGGYTWRGMLQNKVISPPSGYDYATDTGDINDIIATRVSNAFPDLFVGIGTQAGVTVSYQYNRYATLYEGLKDMLKSVGHKMQISYNQETAKVVVQAVPIIDYSSQIEYSSDMNAHYTMVMEATGVNHLICLGSGELRNRTVVHLYLDNNGTISQTQYYTGVDEIVSVYDYAGAGEADLVQSGTDQLKKEVNQNVFKIDLESVTDVAIGDIVGGRDYVTGMKMTAPITTKVITWRDGFQSTEYKLSDDVTVEME